MQKLIILIAMYLLSFGQASATFVYAYTGNQMQSAPSQLNPDPSSLPPGLSSLQFTMVGDLGVDRSYSRFFPISWAINDGVHAFTSLAPPPNLNLYLEFATNGAGAITDWYIQVPTWDPLTNISLLLRTTNTVTDDQAPGAPPQVFDESSACGSPCTGFGTSDYRGISWYDAGPWVMSAAPSSVPEPATIALFSAALGGVLVTRRRKATTVSR